MSGGTYDPHSGLLNLTGATIFGEFHDWSHVRQNALRTLPWRVYERTWKTPVLGRFAMLAVEIEASVMATREMRGCGIWTPQDGREALAGLWSYVRALFCK